MELGVAIVYKGQILHHVKKKFSGNEKEVVRSQPVKERTGNHAMKSTHFDLFSLLTGLLSLGRYFADELFISSI